MKDRRPTVLDSFCGAGGLSLGFRRAGFRSVFAFDNDPACVATYQANMGKECRVADIRKISKKSIEAEIGEIELDVLAGGPPCQGFSVQRRGADKDPRNQLVLEYARLIKEFKPKFFIMENVGGLLSVRGKKVLASLMGSTKKIGYKLTIKKVSALAFGVPQDRRRVFIIGELAGATQKPFLFPEKSLGGGWQTVRQAIGDLASKKEREIPNHRADKLSEINLKRIRSLKQGEGRDSLPAELQLACHTRNDTHRHLDVYGRMWWEKPAPTITARFDSFSRGRFGHPVLDRTITLREGARLQSFPDDFIFIGTKVQVAKQIGNAVPPRLAEAIARSIRECL